MPRDKLALLLVAAISVTQAQAQEQRPSDRYVACQAAADGGDQRIAEICKLVDEFHERLGARDSARHPRDYAQLQHGLGSALFVIGDLGDDLALRESVAASQRAAEYYTRARTPTRWAAIQLQIGGALISLGDLGDQAALQQAATTLRSAIEATRRSEQPALWASLHSSLASAYVLLSHEGSDRVALQEAIAALQAALEIYRRPVYAEERARTEARLAELLRALAEDQGDT